MKILILLYLYLLMTPEFKRKNWRRCWVFASWSRKSLFLAGKEFEVMRYGPNRILKESTSYFTLNFEDMIEEKSSLRYLGIIMSNNATFSSHVEHVCGKVRQKSSWILRTFKTDLVSKVYVEISGTMSYWILLTIIPFKQNCWYA